MGMFVAVPHICTFHGVFKVSLHHRASGKCCYLKVVEPVDLVNKTFDGWNKILPIGIHTDINGYLHSLLLVIELPLKLIYAA